MRSVAIACAAALLCGCGDATVLRITVEPGVSAPPASLVVTLVGDGLAPPPRTIASPAFPGTIVVDGIPSSVRALCVELDGLDDAGNVVGGASATAMLVANRTNRLDVTMSNAFERCTTPGDLGAVDLAAPDGGSDGGARDMAQVQLCPPGSLFCDDFESGSFDMWTVASVKVDAGSSVSVQSSVKAHGTYAMKAVGNGAPSPGDVYADAEKDFTPTAPPLAIRANVFFPTTLTHYDHVIALYENSTGSTNAFAVGGDNNGNWVVAENESMPPGGDHQSDMVPTDAGKWHCVELVIDAAGMVTLFVDNHPLVGPFARATTGISYSTLLVGVVRSVDANYTAYIDDVAVGPSRLYCPP